MSRRVEMEIVGQGPSKRLRIRDIRTREHEANAGRVERMIQNLDTRISDGQAELARLRAERTDLAAKLAELKGP
jgi:hypothetical protein